MQGLGGGLYGAIKVSVRGEYGEDGRVPRGGKASFSWCFSGQGGLGVDDLRRFDIVRLGKERRWLDNDVDIFF